MGQIDCIISYVNCNAGFVAKVLFYWQLKVLDLYVWLSFHIEDSFPDRELASSQKAICSMLVQMESFII